MTATAALARGRAIAENLMVDSCVIGPLVRTSTLDEHGKYTEQVQPVYTGRCRFVDRDVQVQTVDSQGRSLAVTGARIDIPIGAPGSADVQAGHVAVVTLAANDTDTITARIQAPHAQSFATARRLPVEVTR